MEPVTLLLLLLPHGLDLPDPVDLSELVLAKGGRGGGGGSGGGGKSGGGGRSGGSARSGSSGGRSSFKSTGSKLSEAGKVLKGKVKSGRVGKVRKRRGLLVVHAEVERYHRRVGTLLSDLVLISFLTAVILFLSALLAEGTVREAFLAAGTLTAMSFVFLMVSMGLESRAVGAYAEVVLEGGDTREALDAFRRVLVIGLVVCVQALTTALSAHALLRALREGPHPGVPLAVSTAVSGLCTVAVALAFWWGLRVTHGAFPPNVLPGLVSTLKPAFVLAVGLSLGLYWTTFASRPGLGSLAVGMVLTLIMIRVFVPSSLFGAFLVGLLTPPVLWAIPRVWRTLRSRTA